MRGLRRAGTAVFLGVLAGIVSGCVVETGPGPYHRSSWCYWHPDSCR